MPDAHIRVVHCSPDAPTVTVSIGDTTRRVSYGETTEYVTVPSGTTEVAVSSTDGNDRGPLVRATPRVRTNNAQTVLIAGLADQNSLQAITLEDDSSSVRPKYAKLRFVNAVPDGPALDFRFAERVVDGNKVVSRRIAFGGNGSYRTVDAGTREFDIGIDGRDEYRQVVTGQKTFDGGRTYTAIAVGRADADEYDILLLEDVPAEMTAS